MGISIAALVGVMEKPESQWAEKVLSLVHGIEEIYAVVLDAGRLSLHESEQASVDRLVGELKGLLV